MNNEKSGSGPGEFSVENGRNEGGNMSRAEPCTLIPMSVDYLKYLTEVTRSLSRQEHEIELLISLIRNAGAVHVFGFGRSGAAALAFAIRLRHFCEYLPETWWVGDQVRKPIRGNDVVIIFSKDGSRGEIMAVAYHASQTGAQIILVTATSNSRLGALARLKIILPLSRLPLMYGGGDFELAAFFFQELLVTSIGRRMEIPEECVPRNHV